MNENPIVPPLLSITDLTVAFGKVEAVKGVSLVLRPGEILGIVGESGSGKSVTCRALMGLFPPNATVSGSVTLKGRELLSLSANEWSAIRGAELGMVFQNPASHLDPLRRIGQQIAAPLVRHLGISDREGKKRAINLLKDTGIRNPEQQVNAYPHEFSGGMKQRAMIAAAIGCNPKLLIADEPTTALDVTVQARILALLKELNEKRGIAIILVSHDLGVVANICSRVAVMRHGEIVEQGPIDRIINYPQHAYTKLLIESQPGRGNVSTSKVNQSRTPPLLTVENLSVSFPVRQQARLHFGRAQPMFFALNQINLEVAEGETVGIVGESGSGKSTLARAIVRLNRPCGGTIRLDAKNVHEFKDQDLLRFRRSVQMVFQNPYDSLNPRLTILEAVAEPIWRHALASKGTALVQAAELLEMVELTGELFHRKPRQLSGGQCQRVGLARALALRPKMLIADEITSALDVTTQAQILRLLIRLQKERKLALIYISHDLSVVSDFCQRIYVFKDGQIVESGRAQEVLTNPQDPYARELVSSMKNLHSKSGGPN